VKKREWASRLSSRTAKENDGKAIAIVFSFLPEGYGSPVAFKGPAMLRSGNLPRGDNGHEYSA